MFSKQSQRINNFLYFFWCYISSLSFILFFFYSLFVLPSEVILSAILFPIKSTVASAVFWTSCLEPVLAVSIPVYFAVSINFLPHLLPNFLENDKQLYPLTYCLYLSSVEYLIFIMST